MAQTEAEQKDAKLTATTRNQSSSTPKPGLGHNEQCVDQPNVVQRTLEGWCTINKLPPQNSNIVRIFVSSTFSDTKEERNAFMEKVYPCLEEKCREEYGLEFQVMDMRWGVPEQAADNHSTTELCLQEIMKCQEVSVGPSFVALLGHKYGYRPIPYQIPKTEFVCLQAEAAASDDARWPTVLEWYKLDENNTPAVYVLQPISQMLPHYNDMDNPECRKQAQNTWNETDKTLTKCLRKNATTACQAGTITEQQKHRYFMSVTENEIEHGMLKSKRDQNETCLCIIREIPDIAEHLKEMKSQKFIDINQERNNIDDEAENFMNQLKQQKVKTMIPENNLIKVDIEWKASGATISLEQLQTEQEASISTFAEKLLHRQTYLSKHKEYINKLCSEYLEKLMSLISFAGKKHKNLYNEMTTEILQHWHFVKSRCEIFEGRQDVIGRMKQYISSRTTIPLIIFGKSGCGKTSVIAKIIDIVSSTISEKGQPSHLPFRLCFRFLGTTPLTSNVHQVLTSVCQQIASVCNTPWEKPDEYPEIVKSFHNLLTSVAETHRLILIFDSVDQLHPAYNAYSMKWLPDVLPHNVKLIISTLDEGYSIMEALQDKYSKEKGNECQYVEITPLEKDTGLCIIQKWLEKAGRTISSHQEDVIKDALSICGLPLFARIMYDQVRKWQSYEQYTLEQLETTVQGAINKLFEQMEIKFGVMLVKHSLSFLTSSRYGISEVELEHIMSLDDQLLNVTFQYWRPPIRRIPPLLWIRVRGDINSYIVERSADGILVLHWYHRQFIAATKERYLLEQAFRYNIHTIMAEYFSGVWGGGKVKPFNYTNSQALRFGLSSTEASEDRKVPLQPYIIKKRAKDEKQIQYNQRKVSELPFHLAQAENFDRLKKDVFFNIEWLLAKLNISSASELLQEIDVFMSSYEGIKSDKSYKLLYATLQFMKTYITIYPYSLPYELLGRLTKYIKSYPSIRHLVQTCDVLGIKFCPLVPVASCFESAQVELKQSFSTAKSEPWHEGGALCFTNDFRTMYAILYDEAGTHAFLSVWDVAGGNEVQRLSITKSENVGESVDVYFNMLLHNSGKHVVAQYRHFREKLFQRDRDKYTNIGYLDVIDISTGEVVRTLKYPLYGRPYNNSVYYMKGDWIAVRFGGKVLLIHLFEDRMQSYSRPHMMTSDCTKLIKICTTRFEGRFHEGGKHKVKHTKICTFGIKKNEGKNTGLFDDAETITGMAVTSNDQYALLGEIQGEIKLYQLNRLAAEKIIKVRRHLVLPSHEHLQIFDELQNKDVSDDSDSADEDTPVGNADCVPPASCNMTRTRLMLITCPNDQFVISVHQANMGWEAFLWKFTVLKGFIGRIVDLQPLDVRYPQFSHDSQFVVVAAQKEIRILSTDDASVVRIYTFSANIRDICVSQCSNDIAAMLGTEIVLLELTKIRNDVHLKADKLNSSQTTNNTSTKKACLPKEELTSKSLSPEICLSSDQLGCIQMTEVNEKDNLCSNSLLEPVEFQSTTRVALDVHFTPDNTKIIRMFSRIQVLDAAAKTIKYTPFRGDVFFQSPNKFNTGQQAAGRVLDKDIMAVLPISLGKGDKIVGSNGRVRFRVTEDNGKVLTMVNILSYIAVHALAENGPQPCFGVSVYEERIGAVSNNYLVTNKKGQNDQYISVYSMERGSHLTTHAISGGIAMTVILPDETKLLVVGEDLKMHIFGGEMFMAELGCCLLSSHISEWPHSVNEVVTFPKKSDVVLVRYYANTSSTTGSHTYIQVNVTTKRTSPPLMLPATPLDDISCDSSVGIDSQLILYDLIAGCMFLTVPYANRSPLMQIHSRISEDKQRVAFIDQRDDTVHVVTIRGQTAQPLVSCHAHVPKMPAYGGFTFRCNGNVICLKGGVYSDKMVLLVIREPNINSEDKLTYTDEMSRAVSLLPEFKPNINAVIVVPQSKESIANTSIIIEDFLESLQITK